MGTVDQTGLRWSGRNVGARIGDSELGVSDGELGEGESKMKRFGLRALKWPFLSKDIEKRLEVINDYKATFTLALSSNHL